MSKGEGWVKNGKRLGTTRSPYLGGMGRFGKRGGRRGKWENLTGGLWERAPDVGMGEKKKKEGNRQVSKKERKEHVPIQGVAAV